jgi:hypothetical protein
MDRNSTIGARGASTAALLLVLILAGPVSAGHGAVHPAFSTQRVYFVCPGPVADTATWSSAQPGPLRDGNGCGNLVASAGSELKATLCREVGLCPVPEPTLSFGRAADGRTLFIGAFTGNLRAIALELHHFPNLPSTSSYRGSPDISLSIDGQVIRLVKAPVSPGSTALTQKYEISIPALGCVREVLDEAGKVTDVVMDGFVAEGGVGSKLRHISISVDPGWWVWGASEFPAGITFNPNGPLPGAHYVPLDGARADCAAG